MAQGAACGAARAPPDAGAAAHFLEDSGVATLVRPGGRAAVRAPSPSLEKIASGEKARLASRARAPLPTRAQVMHAISETWRVAADRPPGWAVTASKLLEEAVRGAADARPTRRGRS